MPSWAGPAVPCRGVRPTLVDEENVRSSRAESEARARRRADNEHRSENLLHENRRFEPSEDFAANANAQPSLYDEAADDRLAFWAQRTGTLQWDAPWTEVLSGIRRSRSGSRAAPSMSRSTASTATSSPVTATRSRTTGKANRGRPHHHVRRPQGRGLQGHERAARARGVQKGDRVAIYMPMIPETAIAMLACARLGAPHSVVFGGFSSDALKGRIQDADARVVITADGGYHAARRVR